ncbi:AsmA-like C-terminal region-containing protein [Roseiconus lacunae]|uniref:AsmA-like C-terminal region-containing protein n=1 Tax=Roseiconus lacunae TaxID=2605694 RepID=A0ABT7PQ55_9BACT|nr:AsmA-like C-terminal region-containing protein [Roseiconus lacunae]MDM4018642.1 AsmA-like C-terminal region-containing protein [Roseiconus lacunae]
MLPSPPRPRPFRAAILLIAVWLSVVSLGPVSQVCAQPAAPQKPANQYRYWTTNWSFEDIEVGTLAGRLERLGIELPIDVDGIVTVNFEVGIPLNALRTGKAYRIEGTLTGRNVKADQLVLDSVRAEVKFDDGTLTLQKLDAKQGGGTIAGDAKFELLPRGDFSGHLQLSQFRTEAVFDLLAKFGGNWAEAWSIATVDGKVDVNGRTDDLKIPLNWNVAGEVSANEIRYGKELQVDLNVPEFRLKQRRVTIQNTSLRSSQTRPSGQPIFLANLSGSVDLADTPKVDLRLTADDLPLGMFSKTLEGKIDVDGRVQGTVSTEAITNDATDPLQIRAAIASPRLKIAGLDLGRLEHDLTLDRQRFRLAPRAPIEPDDTSLARIRSLSAQYAVSEERLQVNAFEAELFQGKLNGTASLALTSRGQHQFDVRWDDLSPEVTITLPLATKPTTLAATTSGRLNWRVEADQLDRPLAHRGAAIVRISQLTASGESLGRLIAEVSVDGDGIEAAVDGEILGGRLTVHSTTTPDPQASWADLLRYTVVDRFSLNDTSLEQASVLMGHQRGVYGGRLDVQSGIVDLNNLREPIEIQAALRSVRISGKELSPSLAVTLRVRDGVANIQSLRGVYAGGLLTGQGVWSFDAGMPGTGQRNISLRLTRAKGSQILLPVSAEAGQWLSGIVSGQVTVTGTGQGFINKLRVTGNVVADNATAFDLPVGDAHSSLVVTYDVPTSRWSAKFPNVKSSLAGGSVSGALRLASSASHRGTLDMDSRWKVAHVDFEQLLSTYVGTTTIGQGDVTGDLTLSGRRISGARQLRGQFRFRLGGTDASAVPGLSTAGVLLGASALVGTRFNEGIATGRIASGAIVLEEVALVSDRVAVKAEGRVGLLDTRMNVGVVLSTGNFQGQDLLVDLVGLSDLIFASPFGQINRLLSDRTFVFEINGTASSPIIRLLPGESLQANVRRFAVQELITITVADGLFSN